MPDSMIVALHLSELIYGEVSYAFAIDVNTGKSEVPIPLQTDLSGHLSSRMLLKEALTELLVAVGTHQMSGMTVVTHVTFYLRHWSLSTIFI